MAFFRQIFVDGVTIVTAAWLNGIQEVVGASAVAPEYNPSQVYVKGALVSYNNELYRAKAAIATPESWTASHWDAVSLQSLLNEKADTFETISTEEIDTLFSSS